MPFLTSLPKVHETSRINLRPVAVFNRFRGSKVPDGGWTQQTFQTEEGKKLIKDVLAIRRLAIRENATSLSTSVERLMREQVAEVLALFAAKVNKQVGTKSLGGSILQVVLALNVPDDSEGLWEDVITEVLGDSNLGIVARTIRAFQPSVQSVIDHIFTKTKVVVPPPMPPQYLTGEGDEGINELIPVAYHTTPEVAPPPLPTARQQSQRINKRAAEICEKVTRINATTRDRLRMVFKREIKKGSTMGEIIKVVEDNFPYIATNRIPTIVRTELSNAANEGQIMSFEESLSVTHCSVYGCQAVEDASPTYRGFHTCAIQNVPVADLRLVEFHINHTGSWVPTGFRNNDGTVPTLPLGNTAGIGHKDDPESLRYTDREAVGMENIAQLNRH